MMDVYKEHGNIPIETHYIIYVSLTTHLAHHRNSNSCNAEGENYAIAKWSTTILEAKDMDFFFDNSY